MLVVEYPTNWILQRVPVAKYLGFNILAWSTVLACHALCFSFPALVAVRTLLGIFEAVCQPAFLIMTGLWYKREEQAQIVTYWYMMSERNTVNLIEQRLISSSRRCPTDRRWSSRIRLLYNQTS